MKSLRISSFYKHRIDSLFLRQDFQQLVDTVEIILYKKGIDLLDRVFENIVFALISEHDPCRGLK